MESLRRHSAALHHIVRVTSLRRLQGDVRRRTSCLSDAPSFDEAIIRFQSRERPQSTEQGFVQPIVPLRGGDVLVAFLRTAPTAEGLPEWLRHTLTSRESDVAMLASRGLRDAEIQALGDLGEIGRASCRERVL